MKIKILLSIISIIATSKIYSQIEFETHIVNISADFKDVHTADIDGDGDIDILSASRNDDTIAWYENTDGLGTFGEKQIITTNADYATSVFTADIDGDGDIDVLSASSNDDKIAWYKNLNGLGTFGEQQIISTNIDYGTSVYAADIDGDGNIDVLSASGLDNKIAWYENLDGLGSFGIQNIIENNAFGALNVYSIDIDNDGDMDVFYTSYTDNKIAWYENLDGLGNFGNQQVIGASTNGARSVYAADINGDGKLDIVTSCEDDPKISWYENTDGLGNFGNEQIITTSVSGMSNAYPSDIDGDGDIDILSASRNDFKIAWYENINGLGVFGQQQIITSNAIGALDVYAADVDNDSDIDVLSASFADNKIAWYENSNVLSINENLRTNFILHPNPTNDYIYITSKEPIKQIEFYNIFGKKVMTNYNENFIDVSNLKQGIYLCKIISNDSLCEVKKVIRQ